MSGPPTNHINNGDQALIKSYDINSESLKTTLVNAAVDVTVSAFTDSIAIADASGNKVTTTVAAGKRGLDVNVTDITIDAANDSIAIKNGANQLAINADGSINVVGGTSANTGFSTVNASAQISVGTTSTTLILANTNRKYFHIVNNSNNVVFVQYAGAAVLNRGIKLNVGAMLTLSGYELFLGQINAISTTTTINLDILEGV